MFDLHYDLLTYILINKLNILAVKRYCDKIFKNNINGGIFNLFYMSPKQMKEELNVEYKDIDIIQNLKTVRNLINEYNLIPKDIKYIYGIEGLDYLKGLEDVDIMYDLGVRSVNIVWNNDNQFGGGAKGDKNRGLTPLGKQLVYKLITKKIAIDLSHANEKTFFDIIKICSDLKLKGKNPIVFASHSNIKEICNVPRNLSNKQIIEIKKLDGVIGIVGVKPFCIKEGRITKEKAKYESAYLKHINYIKDLLGGTENIAVSTDDMTYYKTNKMYYKLFNVFKQKNMKKKLEELLMENNYSKKDAQKILYGNFYTKILQRL